MTATEKLLRDLIALPSVNPAFAPAEEARTGERRVAEYLAIAARRAGLEVDFQPVFPGRSNLLATLLPPGGKARRRVVLAPHMDTVGITDSQQLKPTRRGTRLYGRGACDTKGSVAAMLGALRELSQRRRRPAETEIVLAALVDEESAQSGSRALAATRFRADLAIVGEPTQLKIVTAHKGDLWLELTTKGRAAHGSKPHLGINAIHAMARAVESLETAYARQLRRQRHPVLGHATINVGMIHGGRQPNIVPDHCAIRVDRRTLPGESDEGVKRELVRFLRARGVHVTLTDTKEEQPAPPMEADRKNPLIRQLLKSRAQTRPVGVDFFTDAGVLAAAGIPSVVFGPGDIAQAHTPDEWIDVRELERAKDILFTFLQSLP